MLNKSQSSLEKQMFSSFTSLLEFLSSWLFVRLLLDNHWLVYNLRTFTVYNCLTISPGPNSSEYRSFVYCHRFTNSWELIRKLIHFSIFWHFQLKILKSSSKEEDSDVGPTFSVIGLLEKCTLYTIMTNMVWARPWRDVILRLDTV